MFQIAKLEEAQSVECWISDLHEEVFSTYAAHMAERVEELQTLLDGAEMMGRKQIMEILCELFEMEISAEKDKRGFVVSYSER